MTGLRLKRLEKTAAAATAEMRVVLRKENGKGFRVLVNWGFGVCGADDDLRDGDDGGGGVGKESE